MVTHDLLPRCELKWRYYLHIYSGKASFLSKEQASISSSCLLYLYRLSAAIREAGEGKEEGGGGGERERERGMWRENIKDVVNSE